MRVMEEVTSDEGKRRKVWERVLECRLDQKTTATPSFYLEGYSTTATPSSYLDKVYSQFTTAKEKTHALADVYINSRPGGSSWQHLLRTLYDEGELAAAKEAKSFLQQKGMLYNIVFTNLDPCPMCTACVVDNKFFI